MVKLFLYGTPDGFSCSECGEKDRALLEGYSVRNQNGNILYGKRMDNGNVYYSYSIYPEKGKIFTDRNGKAGSFFGMAMVFENQEVKDTKKLEKLFKEVYKNYVKDRIVQDLPNGDKKYLVSSLNINSDAIGRYVAQGAAVEIQTNSEFKNFLNEGLKPSEAKNNPLNKGIVLNMPVAKMPERTR